MLLASVVAGYAGGLLCRSFFFFPASALLLPFLLALLVFGFWLRKQRIAYLGCAVLLLCLVLGAGRVILAPQQLPHAFVPLLNTEVTLEGTVAGEPDIREGTQRVPVTVSYEDASTKVLVVAPLYPELRYGERIVVTGTLQRPEPFATDTGRTFRYERFLAKDGIFGIVAFAEVAKDAPPEGAKAFVMNSLLSTKQAFQEGLGRALPEPAASLASGLITGGKQGLGESLLDAFIVAGLVHIVVLSGYNVMIVAEGVLRALRFLPRKAAAVCAGITIGLFVLAAGAGSASIRAGLMAGLGLVARATGRTYAVVRALLVVGVLMLFMNPLLLAYDPGFQLSFLATLGLIMGAPIVSSWLSVIRSEFFRELLAATIAAQISVLPLLLYQTGLLSFVSLPANILVLPFVPIAMALSAIAGVVGMLVPTLAPVVGLPAYAVLTGIIETARFTSGLPLASVTVPQFPFLAVLVLYAVLTYVVLKNKGCSGSSLVS